MARNKDGGTSRLQRAIQYLQEHQFVTLEAAASATGLSVRTMARARAILRGGEPSPDQPLDETEGALAAVSPKTLAEIDRRAAHEPPLDREARRRRLSALATHPDVPPAAQVAALRLLEALEPEAKEQRGPGSPLSSNERIHRAALVLEALIDFDGIEAAKSALNKALTATGCPLEAFLS